MTARYSQGLGLGLDKISSHMLVNSHSRILLGLGLGIGLGLDKISSCMLVNSVDELCSASGMPFTA